MKLKLDENLGRRLVALFHAAGHDTATVQGQQMSGASDVDLIEHCRAEGRALVTLDLDFASPLRFRPSRYAGIAVLRMSQPISLDDLEALCRTLVAGMLRDQLAGKLWIVERERIRVYQERE